MTQYSLLPRELFLGTLILLLASISIHAFAAESMHSAGQHQCDKESRERVHRFLTMENPPRVQCEFAKVLRPEDVDLLYPVLYDSSMQWRWKFVAAAIVALDSQQTRAFNRVVEWVKTGPTKEGILTYEKITSIGYLGWLPPEVSFDYLYDLFLSDAAIKKFLVPYHNETQLGDQIYGFVRRAARNGILSFSDESIFSRIEVLLEDLQGRSLSAFEEETKEYCVEILVHRDFHNANGGMNKATQLLLDTLPEKRWYLLSPYFEKYSKYITVP